MTHYPLNDNQTLCGATGTVVNRPEDITCPDCARLYPPFLNPLLLIKFSRFFPHYAPTVTNVKHKMRGKDGNGQPTGFTEADKAAIRAGLDKFIDALKNAVIGLIIASCVVACSKDNPRPRPTPEEVQAKPVPKDTLTATADPDFAVPGK